MTRPLVCGWLAHLAIFEYVALAGVGLADVRPEFRLTADWEAGTGTLHLAGTEDTSGYYILEHSPDLVEYAAEAIALASPAPEWPQTIAPGTPARFFRLRRVPVDTPLDTDRDGIDDVWELRHAPLLDPLNPNDASLDPDGDGFTHLDDYRRAHRRPGLRDAHDPEYEALSPEVSVFNFGLPSATEEAVSPEVSVFNFGQPTATEEAVSPEVSVFNHDEPTATIEALSPEVSVENSP